MAPTIRPSTSSTLPVIDYIHPDDHARAIGSIAFNATTDEPTTPAPIRLVHRDGKVLTFDFMANPTLRDPTIQALVFIAREASNQHVVDEVLEGMVTGAPLAATLVQTAELMRRPFWSVECAIYFQDDDGEDQVVHTGLAAELLMPERSADQTPWSHARHAGYSVILAGGAGGGPHHDRPRVAVPVRPAPEHPAPVMALTAATDATTPAAPETSVAGLALAILGVVLAGIAIVIARRTSSGSLTPPASN